MFISTKIVRKWTKFEMSFFMARQVLGHFPKWAAATSLFLFHWDLVKTKGTERKQKRRKRGCQSSLEKVNISWWEDVPGIPFIHASSKGDRNPLFKTRVTSHRERERELLKTERIHPRDEEDPIEATSKLLLQKRIGNGL